MQEFLNHGGEVSEKDHKLLEQAGFHTHLLLPAETLREGASTPVRYIQPDSGEGNPFSTSPPA